MKDTLKLFNSLQSDRLSFLYNGILHDEFTDKIIDLFEQNVSVNHEALSLKNKLSFLVAESFQNIVRHAEIESNDEITDNKPGIFIIRNINNVFYITSANLIKNEKIDILKHQLSQINNLGKDELKSLQIEILTTTGFTEKGGAGLGLIQMASKSGNKLEFDFKKISEEQSFFYFQLKIKSKTLEDDNKITGTHIDEAKEIHQYMTFHNTYLAYKGVFTVENVRILMTIIEGNLKVDLTNLDTYKSKIYKILNHLLTNINKHSFQFSNNKEGIFSIDKSGDHYSIITGNYIEKDKVEQTTAYLDVLNSLDQAELKSLHINKINSNGGDTSKLGMLEIARESKKRIEYHITTINEECSFLTIRILI